LKLRRALYGLKQSAHDWYAVLRDSLKTIGFEQCALDPTIYVRNGDNAAMLLVYVDDILVAAPKGGSVEATKAELLSLFKGTDLGPAHYCLASGSSGTASRRPYRWIKRGTPKKSSLDSECRIASPPRRQ
ncbi:unnamed protein product, partial [Tilletia caries]